MRAHPALWLPLVGALMAAPVSAQQPARPNHRPDAVARTVEDLSRLAGLPIGAQVRVALPVDRGEEFLDLTRFTNLTPGAVVVEVDARGVEHPIDLSEVVLLKGTIAGDPDSLAFLSVAPGQVSGFVRADGEVRIISSGKPGADQAVLSALASDLALGDGTSCATDPHDPRFYPGGVIPDHDAHEWPGDAGEAHTLRGGPCRVARIAVDSDYEFTQLFGGNTFLSAAYAQTLLGAVSTIYERDVNVRLAMPYLRVWSANNDPYGASGESGGFLDEVRDHWNLAMRHVPRNAVHGLSGRGLGGGVAYLNALCNSEYGYGISGNLNGWFPLPIQDNSHNNWDLMVVAHELGHNFGSGHTHDSYTPPIDGCGNGDCALSQNASIMSYCHLCPGGLSNMVMRFGERVENRILSFLNSASCNLVAGSSAYAVDDSFRTMQNIAMELEVLGNDAATACEPVTLTITGYDATTVAGGTVSVVTDQLGGSRLLYTPAHGFVGIDSFSYQAGAAGSASVTVEVAPLYQPVPAGTPTEPGVDVDYYVLSNPSWMPDFDAMTPYLSDVVPAINFPSTSGAFATSGRADNVGAVFTSLLEIPQTGWYRLSIESDDGSRLYVGDDLVVDNDGLHGMVEGSAVVALVAGKHPVRAEFFENGGGAGLIVRYQGASISTRPVPASAWSRQVAPPCVADMAPPFGQLDFFDMAYFVSLLAAHDPAADLAAPFGSVDFFDLHAFIGLFNAGCP